MSKHLKHYNDIQTLRSQGLTYSEINQKLGTNIPKSSLSHICKGILLTNDQIVRIDKLSKESLIWKRQKALVANKKIFDARLSKYRKRNTDIKLLMKRRQVKLVALAMLYLGEGAKWKSRRGLMLGSTNPTILQMYISLLGECFGISIDKLKGRVQHRADQDSAKLLNYWSKATGIKPEDFYPSYVDKRTIGKPTLREDYHGVCSVTCSGTDVQLELEQIADIMSEAITGSSYNG